MYIEVLMVNIYEIDIAAKPSRGEVKRECFAEYPLKTQS